MANKYVDGFEWLASGTGSFSDDLMSRNGWYPILEQASDYNVQPGRFGYGKAIMINNLDFTAWRDRWTKTIPDQSQLVEGYQGWAIKRNADSDPNGWHGFSFFDGVSNSSQVSVTFGSNGNVHVYRGLPPTSFYDLTGLIASSKSGCFDEDTWFYAEAYTLIDNSVGIVEVRINTVPVIQVVSADTQATSHAFFDAISMISGAPANGTYLVKGFWDDHYLNDTSGSVNNGFLGNVRVKTQFMIGNGATNNFIIGGSAPAATNWESVLNQSMDDTKFVYSATPGDIDLYVPDPIINAPLVHAVQLRSALRQDDATQRQAEHLLRIGGTNYLNGTIHYSSEIFRSHFSTWDLNPATGVSFTGADVNGFQTGLKLVA